MARQFIVLAMIALLTTGCQTTKTASEPQQVGPSSQSERLMKLAGDIDMRGESSTALALYQRAASLPDAKSDAYLKVGEAYMKAGNPREATLAYQAALTKFPNDGPVMLGLGSAMIEAGDLDAGMSALAKAAPLVNTSSAYNRLGVAQTFAGRTQEAQTSFGQALKLSPGDLDLETNQALAAGLEDNATTAIPLAQKILASPNAQIQHKRNAVIVYGLVGQPDKIRSSLPTGLATSEIDTLLARARTIRTKPSGEPRAKALGSILG